MKRNRRFRKSEQLRIFRRETSLNIEDFILPLFVVEGEGIKKEIESLKDQYHFSIDKLLDEIEEIKRMGVNSIMLFGIPDHKDSIGTGAFDEDGIIQKATRAIKKTFPEIIVITDLCMCEYTSHGHCGILDDFGSVDNDQTLNYLAKIALSQARAGSDVICPSDMMDGRVEMIRKTLDQNGFVDLPIMVHSAKFASNYYGPFRAAAGSCPSHGDRKGYQMDFHNGREAIIEGSSDIEEGADMLIVKPALAYLDVIKSFKENFNLPIITYNVSGEYQMMVKAVDEGIMKEEMIYESLIAMKRAGADKIITYFTKYTAEKFIKGEW